MLAIGRVKTLNMSYWISGRDISALGGVHNLNLTGCDSVFDVRQGTYIKLE